MGPALLAGQFLAFILHVVALILCLCLQEQNIQTFKGTLTSKGEIIAANSVCGHPNARNNHPSEFESARLDETFRVQVATTVLFSLFLVEFAELFTGISVHRNVLSLLSEFYCLHA